MRKIEYNESKLRELILYVARECEGHERFGRTKLNKCLFYADFIAYGRTGEPITGAVYQKLEHGPVPRRITKVTKAMVRAKELAEQNRTTFPGRTEIRPVALREPDLSGFSGEEIAIVDEVLRALESATAKQASDISHELMGWQLAELGEVIPYVAAFVSERKLSPAEIEYGRQVAVSLGL